MERLGYAVTGVYASLLEGFQDVVEWVGGHRPVIALALLSTLAGTGLSKAFPLGKPHQPATINLLEAEWECTQTREIKVDASKVARINGIPVPVTSATTAQMCERFELKEVE